MPIAGDGLMRAKDRGDVVIAPFDRRRVRSVSYVLSLGRRFRRWRRLPEPIVAWSLQAARDHLEPPVELDRITLHPGEFVLACTLEVIGIQVGLFGKVSALSHVARFGIEIHGGADFVNPGYGCQVPTPLTLELYNRNPSPVALDAGMPFVHLRLEYHSQSVGLSKHRSIYEGTDPLVGPLLFEEWTSSV